MAYKTMSTPTVEVNNDVIAIVPGSLEFNDGYGETKVSVASAGGDSKEFYVSKDASTQIGMVSFKLPTAKHNIDLIKEWIGLSKLNGNTITLADTGFTGSFSEMFVSNNPDISTGPDGEVEVKFEGRGSF